MFIFPYKNAGLQLDATGCKRVLYEHLPANVQDHVAIQNLGREELFKLKTVTLNNAVYAKSYVLIIAVPRDELPQFTEIVEIFSVNRMIVLLNQRLETVQLDLHFHVYVVEYTSEVSTMTELSLISPDLLTVEKNGGRHVINSQHSLL